MLFTLWCTTLVTVGGGGGKFGFIRSTVLYWKCLVVLVVAANLIGLGGVFLLSLFVNFFGFFLFGVGLDYKFNRSVEVGGNVFQWFANY